MPATHNPKLPAWPPRSAPRLFTGGPLAAENTLTIEGPQAHYLLRVMRVAAGDVVILCDDQTGEWAARVVSTSKRNLSLEVAEMLREREAVPDFWLCPALLKKDRFDVVLEKATELGAARIQPVLTRRCVADKLNPERAQSIMTEAAEQCARTALPELGDVTRLAALLRDWPAGRVLFFADEMADEMAPEGGGRQSAAQAFIAGDGPAALLIGPEGGFDDAERAAIRAHPSARAISLGPRILRGETAAIAGTALWMGTKGDWA